MRICKFCGKSCKPLGISAHERLCPKNPDKNKKDHPSYGRSGYNQYTKAKLEGRIINMSEETKRKLSNSKIGKAATEKTKKSISEGMKNAVRKYPESYSGSNVNGRVKKVYYKGVCLDGGWELIFAKWCDENSVIWERPLNGFEYEWDGERIYYPDFYLPNIDVYVEIKGYERARDIAKWKSVPNLVVIKLNEIRKIQKGEFTLEWIISKS